MRAGRTSPELNRTLTTLTDTLLTQILSDNVGGVTQLGQEWRSHCEAWPQQGHLTFSCSKERGMATTAATNAAQTDWALCREHALLACRGSQHLVTHRYAEYCQGNWASADRDRPLCSGQRQTGHSNCYTSYRLTLAYSVVEPSVLPEGAAMTSEAQWSSQTPITPLCCITAACNAA